MGSDKPQDAGRAGGAPGVSRLTIARLETATRRPSTTSVWKIAKALWPRSTLHDRVAVDERLRAAAGDSLRDYLRRPHARREAVRRELRAETAAGGGPVCTDADTMAALIISAFAAGPDPATRGACT